MRQLQSLGILLGGLLVFFIIVILPIDWECPILYYLHLTCPTCGLTRAFRALLSFDISLAFQYNMLVIPLVIVIIILSVGLIIDIIHNNHNFLQKLFQWLAKWKYALLIVIVINMIINNIRL